MISNLSVSCSFLVNTRHLLCCRLFSLSLSPTTAFPKYDPPPLACLRTRTQHCLLPTSLIICLRGFASGCCVWQHNEQERYTYTKATGQRRVVYSKFAKFSCGYTRQGRPVCKQSTMVRTLRTSNLLLVSYGGDGGGTPTTDIVR